MTKDVDELDKAPEHPWLFKAGLICLDHNVVPSEAIWFVNMGKDRIRRSRLARVGCRAGPSEPTLVGLPLVDLMPATNIKFPSHGLENAIHT
jgi:hypothetical protein